MNHRDERLDWPTSTTAVVLLQHGQGNGAAEGPLEVVIWRDYSVTTDRRRIACELRRDLRADESNIDGGARARVQEDPMLRASQYTGSL